MPIFSNRKVRKDFDFFKACSWYVPGVGGMFSVLGWFLIGMILAAIVCMPLIFLKVDMCYIILVMYPVQFVPVLVHVKLQSSMNSTFDRGYSLDSNHFGKSGGALTALLAVIATLGASMMLELLSYYLPEMSDHMKETMEALTGGPLWTSLLSTAVFAPVLEEWMCRGVVLRGLLNHESRKAVNGEVTVRKMSPALAIIISAIFFGAIHGNLWQGISAFLIGCLMGYVYYRTGSLKLTILMHCTNNALSVLIGHFSGESLKNAKSLVQVIPAWEYAIIFIVSAAVVLYFIKFLKDVEIASESGNCDVIPNADDRFEAEKKEKEASGEQNILNN